MSQANAERGRSFRIAAPILNMVGTAIALFAVVATGSLISGLLPDPSAWEFAAAYLAPASLAFAAYWWIAQKI